MKRFLLRLLIFVTPAALYPAAVYLVDPFEFFSKPSPIAHETKIRTASGLDPCMWKRFAYSKRPVPNILLGDSTMNNVNSERLAAAAGEEYFNFAYGGGTLKDSIDTFWFAVETTKVRNVYFSLNLIHYNDSEVASRVEKAGTMQRQPIRYFFNRTVARATLFAVYTGVTGIDPYMGVPQIDRQAGWDATLGIMRSIYKGFSYPVAYEAELKKIAIYCRANGIKLVFIIPPSHTDMQQLIADAGLTETRDGLVQGLSEFADVYNFDTANDLTRDANNFHDPIHFNSEIGDRMISEIWLQKTEYAIHTRPRMSL